MKHPVVISDLLSRLTLLFISSKSEYYWRKYIGPRKISKAAIRLILGEKYENYKDGLLRANLEPIKERREKLCKTFAIKCMKSENPRINNIFS